MKRKKERIAAIRDIIVGQAVGNQDELLHVLHCRGFEVTQATLSRDLKLMQIAKISADDGGFRYILPEDRKYLEPRLDERMDVAKESFGRIHVETNETMVIVHTTPGRASGVAYAIDAAQLPELLGTIAGDDTVAVFPHRGVSPTAAAEALCSLLDVR